MILEKVGKTNNIIILGNDERGRTVNTDTCGFNMEEEYICDYLVTTKTKKMWAVEMDLANQLKKICDKHNIIYYAACGTLLGAVRHKGFIPWDDDMDFFMMYEDFKKFCEVAPKELEEPYCFQKTFSMARIRNSNTIGCTQTDIDNAIPPFNLGIFIDIFPLFSLPDNKLLRKLHEQELRILKIARRGERKIKVEKYHKIDNWKSWLNYRVLLWKILNFAAEKDMIEKHLDACAKYEKSQSKEVGIISFAGYKERFIWKKAWFDGDRVYLQYENISLPVPHDYIAFLKKTYGDYNVFVRNGANHTLPIVDPDKPFSEYIEELEKHRSI